MRALLFFYQFWVLIFYCCGVPNSQKQWLSSLKPRISPLPVSNEIPWLVSMPETCQGIILSQWWILSTANCLTKLKHLQSDTSGVVNQEDILLGYNICLHPSFDPQVGTNPVKGDIGLVLLPYPISSEEISLSYNIFQKSCYNCQYRHCRVYQYQNNDKFGTSIKKLSVKLLDLSFCQHQQIHLTKSNNLCIWTQPQEDCWVQQGSPVICFFGNHWELVGLVSESSVACYDPIVVIKTAPYRSWMRWLMKASQKSLDPIFSLLCSVSPGVKNGTQNRISLNRNSTILTSHGVSIQPWKGRLGTLPLIRQHRNPLPAFFGSNNRDTSPDSTQLYFQNSQISSAKKFPWTSLVARLWDTSDTTELLSSSGTGSFQPLVLSGATKLSTTGIPIPQNFPQRDVTKYHHQTMTDSVKPRVKPLVGIIGFHTLPLVNAGGSWVLFSTDIDASQFHSEFKTSQSQITRFSNLAFHSQLPAKPWLEITPNVGSWIHFMPDKTVMQIQSGEESIRTQTYHATDRVMVKPVTYSLHTGIPLIVNKIEFGTHSTVSADGVQYLTATHNLEAWFQPMLNTIGGQASIKRTNEYWIPESMSNQLFTSPAHYVPFTLVPSANNTSTSWAQYKISMIRSSNQMDRITSLSRHKTFILKPQVQTEDTPWLLINTIKPSIHYKINTIRPWIQTETEIVRPLTQYEIGSKQLWTNPEASSFRHWTQSKLNLVIPLSRSELDTVSLWLYMQTDTTGTWNQPESQKIISWSGSETDRVNSWYHRQMDSFKPWLETELQTAKSWSQYEGDIARVWPQSEADNVKHWFQKQKETVTLLTEPITQTVYHWIQSEAELGRSWSQPVPDKVRAWIQHEAYTISPILDEYDGDKDRLWTLLAADTIKQWIQSDDSIITPWVQNEAGILTLYTQTKSPEVNPRTQTEIETVTLLTQGEKTGVNHTSEILSETVTTWEKSEFPGLKSLTHSISDTVTLWTQTEFPALNLWPQPIADTLIQWLKDKPSEINSWSKTISNKATAWTQDESITINTWTQSENDTVIPWSQAESSAINPWTQSIVDTVTEWMQDESAEIIPWEKIVSDQLLLWTYSETPVFPWIQSETNMPYQTGLSLSPSPTESPWEETVSGTVTQWSQVESLVFNSPTQIITDTVSLYMQAKTPSFHSWAMSETEAVITRTSAESLVLSSLKGCETEIVPTWSKTGYSEVNFWTQPEPDTVTSWAQVETPGANSFTQSVVDTVPPWIQAKSSVVNLWTQSVVDVDTLWTQTRSLAVNPWIESVSDSAIQWKQNEPETISQWTQTASDTVKSFSQTEFPIVESLINIVTDIVTLWTEVESTAVIPWTEVVATEVPSFNQTEYPSVTPWTTLETDPGMVWTHANSDIINLLTQTLYHIATLWTHGVILNSWTHFETDTGTAWTHPESSAINSWAWSETKPVTSLSERRYPAFNPWTQIEANKIAPWSQTESRAMNSWIHLENDTVTTFIQGESKLLNQSPVVVTGTIKALTLQVDTPVVNPSTQTDNDRVTLWTKSEILAAYPLPIAVSDTVKVWNMAEIISVKSWPNSVTETGTQWTQNEFPLVYPLTQSITNSVTLITQTINLAMNPRMRLDATAVTPWTQAESPQENARTISKTVIPWTMEFSTIVKSLMETPSDTVMPKTKSEFSEVKFGTSSGASIVPPWTQAESPTVNTWTQSQVNIVTKWTQNDSPTNTLTQAKFAAGNMWTQFELPTINIFTESRFPVLHPSIQTEGHPVTSSTRAGFLALNPWTEIQPTTVTLWIQAEYPIANSWTISETDIATLGIVVKSPSTSLTKSEKHNELPWTQKESPVNPMIQDRANIFTMWTKTESLANPWTKKITDIVTGQTLDKSPIVNYWTDTFASGATPLVHYESPVLNPWAQAITSTLTTWNLVASPAVNPQEETVVSTVAPWIQFESPSINSQAGTIVSTVAWLNQAESPRVIPCTETVTLWMQESTVVNPCSQTIVSIKTPLHAEIPWTDIVDATVTTWNKTETLVEKAASIITIWPQYESLAVNPRVHTVVSTVAPWNEVQYVMINPWTQTPSSTVIPWTQTELPALNIWTQTVFSTMLPWTQNEHTTNSLIDTAVSTVIPWTHAISPKIKTWADTISSEISPWIYTVSPTVETWSDTVSMVTSWTQFLSSAYPSTVTVSSTVTCWTHSESPGISSCTENEIDRAVFWTLLKTESKKKWTLPETSVSTKSLHPKSDTSESVIQIKKPSSLLGIHPEISNIQTLPITGMFMSWIIPLTQAVIFLPKPEVEMSRSWFKTETVRTTHGTQSEYEIVSTLTQFGVKRGDSFTQYETDPLTSWTQTKTGIFNPWNQFERNTVRTSTFSEADVGGPWIQTDPGIVTPWIQHKTGIITSWTKVDSNSVGLQTQTEVTTVTQLSQIDMNTVNHLTTTGINNVIPEFQNQPDTVRSGTQRESQIITSMIRPEGEFVHSWIQSEAKTKLTYFEIPTVKPWPRPESQVVGTLTDTDTVTFWAPTQNDAIGPWSQIEIQATCSVIPNEVGLINSQSQSETSLIRPWTDLQSSKVQPCIHLEAAINRPWAQYETVEINPSIQLEADTAVRPWLQTQMDSIVSEFDTLISCLQTQSATTRPWIHESASPWTQTEVGIILSCTQQRAITDQPWTHHETQAIKPWIKLEANTIKSWFHLQMNKVRPWANSKSPIVSALIQPEVGIVHPWIHPEIQAAQPWNHPETDFTASATLPKSDSVRVRIQPEIQIRNSTHYRAGLNTLFASLEVEPDGGTTTLTSHFDSWPKSVPLLPKETVSLPDEYFVTLSTDIAATESQPQISYFHPSEFTKNFLLMLSSPWLSERVDYLDHGSKLQITKTKGSPYMPTNSPNPLSPSFSFLPPFSLHSSCTLFPSCSVIASCTFTSSSISPSCSILSPMTFFSPILHPSASADSSLQELSSSKFSEETILSHTFSSLFAAPATLLTKQPSLIRGSQSETNSNQPEQDPLKNSEFNISLAECRLGVVWKESFQAFWLFKTAIISHESTECGLRPGLIPHCPNCWEAEVGEFPWMVSVQLSFSHFCAGSILNEQWILTTARCANFIKNSESLALVQVGLIDLQDSAQAQTIGIHRAIPYLGPKGALGPGLLFLKQPLRFQPLVLPICLVENMEQDKSIQLYDCWLPSWSLMRGSPGILQKRHLSILQVSSCAQFWPKLNEFTFCVEAKKAMGEAGCKGDLGAPLVCHLQQKDTWVQVGILSHFDEHCTKPYVFSQVSPFLFWLQGVTRPSHAPWTQQGPMTTSASISTSRSASAFTSTPASIHPHFISLPQPQTLADRISLRYAMPWQVMIISCGNQICSGSIISSSWVLTAAHCVRHMNPEDTAVILGLRHPGTPLRVVKVSTILLHERFRLVSGTARNDLALLLLQEVQTPIQVFAPLGNLKNLNTSECWLAGPRILKQGEADDNPEALQMQVMGASSCAHLYPDIGSSIVCFVTQAKSSNTNVEPVSPGSAVMCRPMAGNGSWRQIGLTSLKTLATIVSPHFSWILSTSAKAGRPLNQAVMPWLEKPRSSSSLTQSMTLLLLPVIVMVVFYDPVVIAK